MTYINTKIEVKKNQTMSFVQYSKLYKVLGDSEFENYSDSSVSNPRTGLKAGDHRLELGVGR